MRDVKFDTFPPFWTLNLPPPLKERSQRILFDSGAKDLTDRPICQAVHFFDLLLIGSGAFEKSNFQRFAPQFLYANHA